MTGTEVRFGAVSERPVFSARALAGSGVVGVLGALGILGFLVTEDDFWPRVWIFIAVVGLVVLASLIPYAYRWVAYIRSGLAIVPTLEDRLREERARTWLALETNALLGATDITMQSIRENGASVEVHLNVGALQGVREGMQFEIVAPPDMEVFGVVRVIDARAESSLCVLEEGEGRSTFGTQLRARLKEADLTPPAGFEVRPFMTTAYLRTNQVVVAAAVGEESADFQTGGEEGGDGDDSGRSD